MNFRFKTIPLLLLTLPQSLVALDRTERARGWWNADRSSIGLAPKPAEEKNAVVQIYAARAYSWRGRLAVHTWVSVKSENANRYTNYEVMGFGMSRGIPVIYSHHNEPDRKWFGNDPTLLFEARGSTAAKMIPDIEKAVKSYAYPNFYRIWPGPNSNTFVSHIIRKTPGIRAELPPHAIGKDWIDDGKLFGLSESKTGIQFSVLGVLGFTIGIAEGFEINILGLVFGVDFLRPALKLPFIGRIGMANTP